jgi:non-specific serine/threonine protein kinase
VARFQGNYPRATALLEEGLALSREVGDKLLIATALGTLGFLARFQGDFRRATTVLEESLGLSRELGHKLLIATALGHLGLTALYQGDYARAARLLEEGLALSRELGDKEGTALGMEELAAVACAQERPELAARLFGAAQVLREAIGTPPSPADQARYDRSVAAARAGLGEHAFAAAWVQGRAMAPEQAIAGTLQAMAGTAPQIRDATTVRARRLREESAS